MRASDLGEPPQPWPTIHTMFHVWMCDRRHIHSFYLVQLGKLSQVQRARALGIECSDHLQRGRVGEGEGLDTKNKGGKPPGSTWGLQDLGEEEEGLNPQQIALAK